MARADSTIRVAILGDAKGLSSELKTADKGIRGFATSAKGIVTGIGVAVAGAAIADFAGTALAEADRLEDAAARLRLQVGPELQAELEASADDFSHLGQSAQDMLELEAAFADTAVALGQGAPDIASWADDAAAIAAAMELLGQGDAAGNVDAIGKAAGGSERALKTLGIDLSEAEVEARALRDTGKGAASALTDQELAAARYNLILEKLRPRLDEVNAGQGDVEQSSAELQAKWETLTGKIGQAIEGPLNDLLGWIIQGVEGWELFADNLDMIRSELRKTLGPIYAVTDALSDLLGWLGQVEVKIGGSGVVYPQGRGPASSGGSGGSGRGGDWNAPTNINVYGGDPTEVERTIRNAVRGYTGRGGVLFPE